MRGAVEYRKTKRGIINNTKANTIRLLNLFNRSAHSAGPIFDKITVAKSYKAKRLSGAKRLRG